MTDISKIKKVLALTNSPNEAEAMAAVLKAQELANKYNLKISDIDLRDQGDIVMLEVVVGKRIACWKSIMMNAIANVNLCKLLRRSTGIRCQLFVVGRTHNTLISVEMFNYLTAAVKRVAVNSCKGKGRAFASSFKIGAAKRIDERLKDKFRNLKEPSEEIRALMIVEASEKIKINEHIKKHIGTLANHVMRTKLNAGYSVGKKAADNIGLDQQIKGAGLNRRIGVSV